MSRPQILIIEDDQSVCELLQCSLEKLACRLRLARSGEEGLGLIEEDRPSLVILDLGLPGMNGLDVCRTMRRDPWMSKIPVLMLTGKVEEDDVITGLEVGADDYMTKPFSPKLLQARVKVLLRKQEQEPLAKTPRGGTDSALPPLKVKTLGQCEISCRDQSLDWSEQFSPSQRQLLAMLLSAPLGKLPQEEVQLAFWPDSPTAKARSSFDSLLSRTRRTLEQGLKLDDSRGYLIVRRGVLCLENAVIDAHEFQRQVRTGLRQVAEGNLFKGEISLSSAFSLWQGRFLLSDFGSDRVVQFQDELEQLYLEASQTFARLLAKGGRYQEAVKVLRYAQRYDQTNDGLARLLYQIYLAQDHPGQARQVLQLYRESLEKENFAVDEIDAALDDFVPPGAGGDWLS